MSLQEKIKNRLDALQLMLENGHHLQNPQDVEDVISSVAKFWSVLTQTDREYIQCARDAVEEQIEWNVRK